MSLLENSRPGRREQFADGSEWLVIRRSVTPDGGNVVTLTVVLVRSGSDADPSIPRDTDSEGT